MTPTTETLARAMANNGLGWEDICVRLSVNREQRADVRSIVLKGHLSRAGLDRPVEPPREQAGTYGGSTTSTGE